MFATGGRCHGWQLEPCPFGLEPLYHFSLENSHLETRHQGVMFRSPWAFVGVTTALRYEPCTQFINVSQRVLHIYWQFSAMSHAIHKIVSIKRCQSYFISRRSPHLGISKDSESCASAHRCLHYAYARLIARVTFHLFRIFHNVFVLHEIIDQRYYGEDQRDPHNNIGEDL